MAADIFLVDTHCHLDMHDFERDRAEVIARARQAGVGRIICAGVDVASSRFCIALAERYPEVLATVGIHPHQASTATRDDIATLEELAGHPRVVAIGELGLDFHRNYSPRDRQLEVLGWQLELAARLEMPVVFHSRDAFAETVAVLQEWTDWHRDPERKRRGVIHCFTGDITTARTFLELGFYLGLGAYIGYPGNETSAAVIGSIPADRLLLETDAPFLPPQSKRGQRHEPAYMVETAGVVARARGVSFETVARETTTAARSLFRW